MTRIFFVLMLSTAANFWGSAQQFESAGLYYSQESFEKDAIDKQVNSFVIGYTQLKYKHSSSDQIIEAKFKSTTLWGFRVQSFFFVGYEYYRIFDGSCYKIFTLGDINLYAKGAIAAQRFEDGSLGRIHYTSKEGRRLFYQRGISGKIKHIYSKREGEKLFFDEPDVLRSYKESNALGFYNFGKGLLDHIIIYNDLKQKNKSF